MPALDLAAPENQPKPRWKLMLWDRLQAQLDQWFSSPSLYRLSIATPLTRWFTQRQTRRIFDLMAGFVHTQVLLTCVRLNLFNLLRERPRTLNELASDLNMEAGALQRLLLSAVAIDLLQHRSGQRFGLGALGAPIAGQAGIAAMIEHNNLLFKDMAEPVDFLRHAWGGNMALYWPYAHGKMPLPSEKDAHVVNPEVARYSALMAASQNFVVEEIFASYDFSQHRSLLDVGGGQGRFVSAVAQRYQSLSLGLFDLPGVVALTHQKLTESGLQSRVQLHGGSFLTQPIPQGADVVTLIRVAHDHPDADVLALLRNIYASLQPGGTLVLAEPMAKEPGEKQPSDAYFHYYLLAMGAGRLRTQQELADLMIQSGFSDVQLLSNAMPIHTRILKGSKN